MAASIRVETVSGGQIQATLQPQARAGIGIGIARFIGIQGDSGSRASPVATVSLANYYVAVFRGYSRMLMKPQFPAEAARALDMQHVPLRSGKFWSALRG
jgi:hypothetical protein